MIAIFLSGAQGKANQKQNHKQNVWAVPTLDLQFIEAAFDLSF